MLVSYDMNRLQRLAEPRDYVVTLNGAGRVDPDRGARPDELRAPVYTPESVAAQRRLPELNDGTLAFAGAYHGWGFHEDGCAAGVAGRRSLGVDVVSRASPSTRRRCRPCTTPRSATCAGRRSTARSPTASTCGWSTWTTCRRCRGGCARSPGSRRATTSATRTAAIRQNLDAYLATQGVDLRGGRVLMLANARVLGLRVQPAHAVLVPPGRRHASSAWSPRCTTPTASGTATCCGPTPPAGPRRTRTSTSPRSSPWTGDYRMVLPGARRPARISITLRQHGDTALVATVPGTRRPATPAALARMLLRHPLVTAAHVRPDPPPRHRAVAAAAARHPSAHARTAGGRPE